MEKLLDVAKRRGFFWQSAMIYGGISGFWDYGHLGSLLKRKFENLWRNYFLSLDDNFYEIQTSLILPKAVFEASGHLKHFVDPVVKCKKCGNVERADHILEDRLKESFEGISEKKIKEIIKKHNIRCPKCKGSLEEVGYFNMLFPVNIGVEKNKTIGYLTGETAQGAYLNFKQEFECIRRRLPMGIAIVGKAFRNEISPRNALIRMREFTQAELQIFFDPDEINEHPDFESVKNYKVRVLPLKNRKSEKIDEMICNDIVKKLKLPKFYVYYMAKIQQFYLDVLKLDSKKFRIKELNDEEKAFYNKYHWDIELHLRSLGGWKEVAGLHYRTDHDLGSHQKLSKRDMKVNVNGKSFVPHVLEISFGIDRNVYALLDVAYDEEEERTVLRFPRMVSPFDTGVFPLVNKDGLPEKAKEIKRLLEGHGFIVFYDKSGSIGRRYRRMDEIGCPAGITIDYDTLKNNDVTLRDRDSMKQIRVPINKISDVLRQFLNGEKLEHLGRIIN
jgi:glycyl-tRNA synthetase